MCRCGARPVRRNPRAVPRGVRHVRRAGDGPPPRALGGVGNRRPRRVHVRRGQRVPRHRRPRRVRRRGGRRLPLQRRDRRGAAACRRQRRWPRHHPAQRRLPAVLQPAGERRAEEALAAGDLCRRTDHRRGDDRTRHRLRSGVDGDQRGPRWRALRRQRLEDVHHQWDQRRPRDHRREDRPCAAPSGDVAAHRRARHAGIRARPQPRQGRHARPGHRRAVLHRRPRAGGQPARRRRHGIPPARRQPRPRSGCRSP